jgi:hypothetical protein
VLGAPFYVMERVTGVILRAQPPPGLILTPELMRRLSESFIDNLVAIHAVDCGAAGLGDLGRPEGYVARQVEGWAKRYLNARTDDIAEMESLAAWLHEHRLVKWACLIHNDYKCDNLVLVRSHAYSRHTDWRYHPGDPPHGSWFDPRLLGRAGYGGAQAFGDNAARQQAASNWWSVMLKRTHQARPRLLLRHGLSKSGHRATDLRACTARR